jgi:hypothetical protein
VAKITLTFLPPPSRIYLLCVKAAEGRRKELVLNELRNGDLSREDLCVIADFFEGKFDPPKRKRGQHDGKPDEQRALRCKADEVRRIKRETRAQGTRLRHADAIELVVRSHVEDVTTKIPSFFGKGLSLDDVKQALELKLNNFMRRSKSRVKPSKGSEKVARKIE